MWVWKPWRGQKAPAEAPATEACVAAKCQVRVARLATSRVVLGKLRCPRLRLTLPRMSLAYFLLLEAEAEREAELERPLFAAFLLAMAAVRSVATRLGALPPPAEGGRFFARFGGVAAERDAAATPPTGATTLCCAARAASGTSSSSSSLRVAKSGPRQTRTMEWRGGSWVERWCSIFVGQKSPCANLPDIHTRAS